MTPFAELSAAMNAYVVEFLADAEADFGGAVGVVPGLFDNEYAEAFGMVGGSQPVLVCISDSVSGVVSGSTVTIGAIAYVVVKVEPDGKGMTKLHLDAA